jgi:FixJ family two-component response regulator
VTPAINTDESRRYSPEAYELLIKPFETSHLIDAVERGIHRDYREVMRFLKKEKLESNLKKLTKRERELYDLLIKAFNNKELVTATGLALNTVKDYKTNVMQKMQVSTVAELIKISGVD